MNEYQNAPGVERVLALLNSTGVGFEAGNDLLASPESAGRLMTLLGMPALTTVGPQEVAELKRLRGALLDLMRERGTMENAIDILDDIAQEQHFRYRFHKEEQVKFEPVRASATAQLIEDMAVLIGEAKWDRVKTCANESCGSIFYDPTRAKTRRWHSYEICGNKKNVAAFRQRIGQSK